MLLCLSFCDWQLFRCSQIHTAGAVIVASSVCTVQSARLIFGYFNYMLCISVNISQCCEFVCSGVQAFYTISCVIAICSRATADFETVPCVCVAGIWTPICRCKLQAMACCRTFVGFIKDYHWLDGKFYCSQSFKSGAFIERPRQNVCP